MSGATLLTSLLVPAALGVPLVVAAAVEFHVGPHGNETATGAADDPVQTITRATQLARQARGENPEGYRVVVHDGTYYLNHTVELGPADSGIQVTPTRIEAAPGASPRIVGGQPISGWEPHEGDVLKVDLEALGLGGVVFRELYCNDRRQILARYPNYSPEAPNTQGWLYIEAPAEPNSRRAFIAYPGDLKQWEDLSQAEIFQFHSYNYYNTVVAVESVESETRTVTLVGDTYNEIRGDGAERYFFQNILEELDEPGEWYLDRDTSTLYFWPPAPIEQCRVEVPVLDFAFHLQPGAEHIAIEGLTVEVARRTAIHMQDARHCLAMRNTIRHCGVGTQIGGWGPWEDCCGIGIFGGERNGAVGNDISHVGGHGIKLTGGDVETLTPAENYAENNYIHHTGLDWKQGLGARLQGVGNRFSRNTVHSIPRMAVLFHGWDLVVELNHMYNLNLETCDTGAIYTGGRDGVSPWGCVVRYNHIHDVVGFGRHQGEWVSPYYSWGIYLDDLASGVEVTGNIVEGTVRGGVHIHSGRHNLVQNNILVGAQQQQVEFNGWHGAHGFWTSRLDSIAGNWEQRRQWPAWQRFERLFEAHPRDWGPQIMEGNRILRNILVATAPRASIYRCNRLPYDRTEFEHNLLWLGGRPPELEMATPVTGDVGEQELAPNPTFEHVGPDGMPRDWRWYSRPSQAVQARVAEDEGPEGRPALEITCAPPAPGSQFAHPMVMSADIPIEPGGTYRLAARFRADRPDVRVNLVAQSFGAGRYHWARETPAVVGTQWQEVELGFTTPGPDAAETRAGMETLYIRLDCREEEGTLRVADISLREAEVMDDWGAWQRMGHDRNSVVADPLFVDAEAGDYRLRPESPAFALGFEPIPVDRIGCHEDPSRASWPVGAGR